MNAIVARLPTITGNSHVEEANGHGEYDDDGGRERQQRGGRLLEVPTGDAVAVTQTLAALWNDIFMIRSC